MLKLLLGILILTGTASAATVKGSDGRLPYPWKLAVENGDGSVDLICDDAPHIDFNLLNITCIAGNSESANARIEGPAGRLGGWRIAAPDGLQWRTICDNPYADMDRQLIICRR